MAPEAFSGDAGEDGETDAARLSVSKLSSESVVQSDLREELRALKEELLSYDISFSDLADASPKSEKTRHECALAVAAIFLPPPLLELIKKKKKLPLKEIERRSKVKRKLLDRHRKHLLAVALVIGEDYPVLKGYFPYGREN